MKSIRRALLNLLIAFQVFIVFFLLFESRIHVPASLQVLGRAHPLLLHFPIVLLVLVWLLECFGEKLEIGQPLAKRLTYTLLLLTAWSTAITVVAGLLLSKEGGYEGPGFQWHKWPGVALCFLCTGLLWYHGRASIKAGRYPNLFRIGSSIALVVLLVAGHYGAGLTHGEDYLFEPIQSKKQKALDMEAAIVFPDLVYPILEAKCLSCHSPSKAKGGLVLSDTTLMMEGGDSGPVLVRGSADESLLVQRLLLNADHEHHMPPKGKPQLTDEELVLIEAWVASGAKLDTRLSTLAADDTIRQLAIAIYGPPKSETYDFPAADAETVAKLNTPYRIVKPVAQGSPALAVGFYGKANFTAQSLKDLVPVGPQVVTLSLSGMPLSEADREVMGNFTNLRELILNGTPVDDGWSEALAALANLRTISLSGTNITEAGLVTLLTMPKLRHLYVWNTQVEADMLDKLQQQHKNITIERGYQDDGQTILPLNNPVIKPASSFFKDDVVVTLSHPIAGVELRYTLDGTEPDSIHSPIYKEPFILKTATPVRVKGYKSGWLSSTEVSKVFRRSANRPSHVYLLTPPDSRYKGRGAFSLTDLESGGDNHADGKWLGFHGEPMNVSFHFDEVIHVDTIGVSVKQQYGAHIYPPKTIQIWGGADSASARLLNSFQPMLEKPKEVSARRIVEIPARGESIRYLRLEVEPFVPIPQKYPAEGNPAWIFVDEVIIN